MKSLAAWVITLVWVALYARKLADPSFPVPAEVTPVMLLAAGYLFGKDVKEKIRDRVGRTLETSKDLGADSTSADDADVGVARASSGGSPQERKQPPAG